jgi:hypothetical protein
MIVSLKKPTKNNDANYIIITVVEPQTYLSVKTLPLKSKHLLF